MRSFWPATGVWALTLAAACARPNPGFKLNESSEAGDSEAPSASLATTEPGPGTDTPPTGSDASGMTTATATSEGVTGSTSGTSSTETTAEDTTDSTTMEEWEWVFPPTCDQPLFSEFTDAVADTFLVNEVPGMGACDVIKYNGNDCRDLAFSLSEKLGLALFKDPKPTDETISIYAVRFAKPTPMHNGNIPIPEDAFLEIEARIWLFRPNGAAPWEKPMSLRVRRFVPDDGWSATEGQGSSPCFSSSASYRCRKCPAKEPANGGCAESWSTIGGSPYDPKGLDKPLPAIEEPGPAGLELLIRFATQDLQWLQAEGLMMMTADDNTPINMIEVRTLESAWHPGLRVHYCEPTLKMVKN